MANRTTVIYLSCIHLLVTVFAIFAGALSLHYHNKFGIESESAPRVVQFFSTIGWMLLFLPIGLWLISRSEVFGRLNLKTQTFSLIGVMTPVIVFVCLSGIAALLRLLSLLSHT